MDAMDEIRQTFFLECEDLLQVLMEGLSAIDEGDDDPETVNAIFRAVHSIKGGAGAFSLDDLVRFAHAFETTLDEVRNDNLQTTPEVMALFFRCGDMLTDLVEVSAQGGEADTAAIDQLIAELDTFIDSDGEDGDHGDMMDFQPLALDLDLDLPEPEGPAAQTWTIQFAPHPNLMVRGNDPVLLLRALSELGEMQAVCDASGLPEFDALDTDSAFLSWTITLESEADKSDIEEIFEFVEGDCDLSIELAGGAPETGEMPADTAAEVDDDFLPPLPEPEEPAADAETAPVEAEAELSEPEADTPAPETQAPDPKAASAAPAKGAAKPETVKPSARATVRVELDRVDRLINLIGELVINQSMLAQAVTSSGISESSPIVEGLDEFKHLTRAIQEGVMAIRAQPVKPLFQRMSRIVREAASATGKSVRLVTEGESTEVDKTVIERLSDPLTHMIRNAVDHGLEDPEGRTAAGKPEEGTVTLSATHRSGRVLIEISDDGAGINRERVKQIAIDKGLIPADAQLTESEIDNLLFMPGFSTAKEVSNLSGRGVGMDVVKKAIQSLGGRVNLSSVPGQGTSFVISLPLTLAILDGMVVKVAGQTKVIPLTDVVETLKPKRNDVHGLSSADQGIVVRGDFVPLVDIGTVLGFREPLQDIDNQVIILTETEDSPRTACVVDEIVDQRQVVIKGLEDNYQAVPGIAAATILGNGEIALILDVGTLVTQPRHPTRMTQAA